MVKQGGCYFLSRPRRFGKTLLLDTLGTLLEGNRELFKGLWIDSSGYDFRKHQVIKLSMPEECSNVTNFENFLIRDVKEAAMAKGADLNAEKMPREVSPAYVLRELVRVLYYRERIPVAILIDEYDAPIQRVLGKTKRAAKIRMVLQDFYSHVKKMYENDVVRVVFVTGITKFAYSTITGFNNYIDLTLDPEYNAVCGFTPDEFMKHFEEYLPDVLDNRKSKKRMPPDADLEDLKKEIIDYYDGYSWDGKNRVLNPFSTVMTLREKTLGPHWYDTANPSLLFEILERDKGVMDFPVNAKMTASYLNKANIENPKLNPLLFYSGYLTVEKIIGKDYFFKLPNKEIVEALNNDLLDYLFDSEKHPLDKLGGRIRNALEKCDATSLAQCFSDILSWRSPEGLRASEGRLSDIIFVALKCFQFKTYRELTESEGRMDLFVALDTRKAFIFEIKHENYPCDVNKLTAKQKNEWEAKTAEKLLVEAKEQIDIGKHDVKYRSAYPEVKDVAMAIAGHTRVAIGFFDPKENLYEKTDFPKDSPPNTDS
jgi:hypothetical protein